MPVQVMTRDDNAAAVYIKNPPDVPGLAFRIFEGVAQGGVDVDMILQTASYNRGADIVFTVNADAADRTAELLTALLEPYENTRIQLEKQCTKLCVTGDGLNGRNGYGAVMLRCLWESGIKLYGVTTSDVKMTMLIPRDQSDAGYDAIMERLFFEE